MRARDFQKVAPTFDTHEDHLGAIPFAMGLAAEAGEVANEFERMMRKGGWLDRDKTRAEMGDVLWHLANLAEVMGWDLEEIMDENIAKLTARYAEEGIPRNG